MVATAIGAVLSGCTTSLGTQNTASYFIQGQDQKSVFNNAVHASVRSGLSLTSTDYDAGLIVAEAARNAALTHENTKMNIFVSQASGGTAVSVSSILGGQVYDYGSSANAISRFCYSFSQSYPRDVTC